MAIDVYVGVQEWLPVELLDSDGVGIEGLAYTDVTIRYKLGRAAVAVLTLTDATWEEGDHGVYNFAITPSAAGSLLYWAEYDNDGTEVVYSGAIEVLGVGTYTVPSASAATLAGVADYMGIAVGTLPADTQRMIYRAQELIDYVTMKRCDVDDTDQMEAVNRAVCAQVEYWIESGEGVEFEGGIRSKTIGRTSITYVVGGGGGSIGGQPVLAPRARRALFLQGLLYQGAYCGVGLAVVPDPSNFDEFGI